MVRIVTDSASDLTQAEAKALCVQVVPLHVTLEDGMVLRDGVDTDPDWFYSHLASCKKLPTTSQPSPDLFAQAFEAAKAAGDEVVVVSISAALSGTCQSASIGASMAEYEEHVYVVDSCSVCLAQALLVRRAAALREEGLSAADIAADLECSKRHLHLYAVADTLKYLRKGGRLPAAVAVAGGMLGIKPIISIKEGKVALAGKARGLPGAYVALFKSIETAGGIDLTQDFVVGYSDKAQAVEPICRYFSTQLKAREPLIGRIGCVVGTHIGPGAFGLAFFDAEPDAQEPAEQD